MDETARAAFHPDFEQALVFATKLHAKQTRIETDIPYISHLISVAALVLEYGGGRDEAIGGLLHDSRGLRSGTIRGKSPRCEKRFRRNSGRPC